MIPFGDWMPDQPPLNNPGTSSVRNVLPFGASYRPLRGPQAITDPLPSKIVGAASAQKSDGSVLTFAGTTDKLYKAFTTSWTDASGTSAPYAVPADDNWQFAQFGDLMIAANISNPPQKFNIETDSVFSDLGGSPPKARYMTLVRDFLVMANFEGNPNGVYWSAFNDPEDWIIGTNQSDSQTFPDGGWVQGILGGETGYVFLERSIIRMTATGDDYVFQFDVVERGRGLLAPGSLVQVGQLAFFLAYDGFYQFQGGQAQPIGANKIDKSFFKDVNEHFLPRISGVADPINKVVMWSYPSIASIDGTPDKVVIYNWITGQWSQAEISAEILFPLFMPGYSLESLDTVNTSIDALAFSLDSRLWNEGALTLGLFDPDHKMATLTGDTLEAVLESKEAETVDGRRSFVNEVRPIVDCANASIRVGRRERLGDALTYTASSQLQASGRAPVRASGRYHRAELTIPAGENWTAAQGIDFISSEDGEQ